MLHWPRTCLCHKNRTNWNKSQMKSCSEQKLVILTVVQWRVIERHIKQLLGSSRTHILLLFFAHLTSICHPKILFYHTNINCFRPVCNYQAYTTFINDYINCGEQLIANSIVNLSSMLFSLISLLPFTYSLLYFYQCLFLKNILFSSFYLAN